MPKNVSLKISNYKRSPCLLYCDVRFLMTTDARGKQICILLLNESLMANLISQRQKTNKLCRLWNKLYLQYR